jgi:hypothetical protein
VGTNQPCRVPRISPFKHEGYKDRYWNPGAAFRSLLLLSPIPCSILRLTGQKCSSRRILSMFRFIKALPLGILLIPTLNAGQIQIGGTSGLTSSYVLGASACSGASAYNPGTFTGCLYSGASIQGNLSSSPQITGVGSGLPIAWLTKADVTGLFERANNSGVNEGTSPITDTNGVTFNLSTEFPLTTVALADYGLNSTGNAVPGMYQLTIPIGIFGVTSVDTMLQDFWASSTAASVTGAPNATGQSTAITFEFSSTSNGSSGNIFETVYLTNGQQIRDGITCTVGCTGLGAYQTGFAPTSVLSGYLSSTLAGSLNSSNPEFSNVNSTFTPNLFSAAYTNMGAFTAYSNSTGGTVQRDAQSFSFGNSFADDYLVAVIISNQLNPDSSKVSLGAITVQQLTPTPEPATVVLLLTGLASIGVRRFRRKR